MSITIVDSAFRIRPERAVPPGAVEHLYDQVFGAARFQKASHRFRTGVPAIPALSFVATEESRIIGAIRYWPVLIGARGRGALLLGPLAIVPERAGRGVGSALVKRTLALAADHGHDLVLLCGDVDYYARFGFVPATPHGFVMPFQAQPERLQVLSLQGNDLDRLGGTLRAVAGAWPTLAPQSGRAALQARAS